MVNEPKYKNSLGCTVVLYYILLMMDIRLDLEQTEKYKNIVEVVVVDV